MSNSNLPRKKQVITLNSRISTVMYFESRPLASCRHLRKVSNRTDETRDFPCIPVLPENFQSAPPVFYPPWFLCTDLASSVCGLKNFELSISCYGPRVRLMNGKLFGMIGVDVVFIWSGSIAISLSPKNVLILANVNDNDQQIGFAGKDLF